MANNGGPWGGGGNNGGNNPWGGGGRSSGPLPTPPDLEELLRRSRQRFRQAMPGQWGPRRVIPLVLIAAVLLLGATGLYTVPDGQVSIVQRFGAPVRTEQPGLQWRIPFVERVSIVSTSQIFRLEVAGNMATSNVVRSGYKSGYVSGLSEDTAPNRMVTRDLNLVEVDFTVFWQINDPQKFLFNIKLPESTLKLAAESVVREVIGRSTIEDIIPVANPETAVAAVAEAIAPADGQAPVAALPVVAAQGSLGRMAIEMRDRLQQLIDSYDAGIKVTDLQLVRATAPQAVAAAFADVQKAQQDASSAINEAQVYANNTHAEATGQSSRAKAEATAYKAQIVSAAQGDADRFLKVLDAYRIAEDTTATRLYLETMEQVLKGANKVILDGKSAAPALPYLPLTGLKTPGNSN